MNPFVFFLLNLKASLFSTGGLGNVPSLHADLIARGVASEKQFAASLAVGQLSPGPNGLWVIALGFALNGVPGALITLVAICIPALLVLAIRNFYQRHSDHKGVEGFIWGLSLATVVEFCWTMSHLVNTVKPLAFGAAVAAISFVLSLRTKVPVILIIAVAAVVGILLGR